MSLTIKELEFSNFRNYENFALEDIGSLTVFVGRNGVGKTNILEGIDLLTSCESFRHAQIAHLVKEGCSVARLSACVTDGNRLLETVLAMEPGKKKYQFNGKAKSVVDMKGIMPSVSFTPDDLELAKKSSAVKRGAIDALGMQLTKNYHVVSRDYEKLIRHKNKLLKEEASPLLVDSINDTLVICGSQLFCYRVALFNRIVPHVTERYREIAQSDEVFSAAYYPSWAEEELGDGAVSRDDVRELFNEALQNARDEEFARHKSVIGPHADKITFMLDKRDASQYASQGQQRSIVLAWKLAEVEVIRQSLGVSPVLLLDDVMSELDSTRREQLVGFVTDDIQTFITATDLDCFTEEILEKARVIAL